MHHDTAGDTLGWLDELPLGGRESALLLHFQVALKFIHLSWTAVKFHLSHRDNAHSGQQIKSFKGSSSLQSSS